MYSSCINKIVAVSRFTEIFAVPSKLSTTIVAVSRAVAVVVRGVLV